MQLEQGKVCQGTVTSMKESEAFVKQVGANLKHGMRIKGGRRIHVYMYACTALT